MASYIANGARTNGATVDVIPISQCDPTCLESYDRFAFGCPASAQEDLEEIEFLPYYEKLEAQLGKKVVALFGSYSWGNQEWMDKWNQRVVDKRLVLFEKGLAIQDEPTQEKQTCTEFGKRFAAYNP